MTDWIARPLLTLAIVLSWTPAVGQASIAVGQASIEVRVFETLTGEPLPGVKVELTSDNQTKYRFIGTDGNCSWRGLEPGRYVLRLSMAGFQSREQTVELAPGSNDLRIDLEPYRIVSLVRLLGSPEDFDGLPVAVAGFCSNAFEDQALYLGRDHWRHGLVSNSVRLDADPSILSDKYHKRHITVRGVFAAPRPVDLHSGRIHSITQVSINDRKR